VSGNYGYGRRAPRRPAQPAGSALVTPRQAAALDKMAAEHGFASGTALLCDVASCDAAELGRKSRQVVQMFVDQAFQRYGRAPAQSRRVSYARLSSGAVVVNCGCEDYPCCGH